jgi:SAM-dependent methyltransferase
VTDKAQPDPPIPWLDEQQPHEESHSRAQIDGLCELLAPAPKRVLDLGCGTGRVLVPLAQAGHELTGIDRNDEALAVCRKRLGDARAILNAGDFREPTLPTGPYDAVLCLGNTFMTVANVDGAVDLMRRVAATLTDDGAFIIDDIPSDFWPELTGGAWQTGLSEDGALQMVWDEADAVFALRSGAAVAGGDWRIGDGERRFRLWTDGSLRLAARAAGLSAPQRRFPEHLLVMRSASSATRAV